jgi:hypothetical protein
MLLHLRFVIDTLVYNALARRLNNMLTVAENHARSMRAALAESGAYGSEPPHPGAGHRPSAPSEPSPERWSAALGGGAR